jgi:hypothetical protein
MVDAVQGRDTSVRDTISKGGFVQGVQHPRIFGRGHIGRGHINPGRSFIFHVAFILLMPRDRELRARICKRSRSPGIDSVSLCSLESRYVKKGCYPGTSDWESIPGLLKRLTNSVSGIPSS